MFLGSVDSSLIRSSRALRFATALVIAASAIALGLVAGPAPSRAAGDITGGFDWTPAAPVAGNTVTFTARAEASDGATITSYEWDLDGTGGFEAKGSSASRTYPAPTNVRVRLRVKDSAGKNKVFKKQLSVAGGSGGGEAPVASFTFSPSAPFAGQPVLFTSTSSDPDGSVTGEVWDLNGDGNFDNGGGHTALRTFPAAGEYVVGLSVTDNGGLVSFDSQTVTVGPQSGTVNQNAGPKAGLRLLSPFPVVRIAGRITRRGTRVRLLRVAAPNGVKVSVRCDGRGCPFRKQVRAVSASPKSLAATVVRVRRLERLIPAGVRVRVFVTRRGTIGKYTRFRFRAGKAPVRVDRCVMPGTWAPSDCPAA